MTELISEEDIAEIRWKIIQSNETAERNKRSKFLKNLREESVYADAAPADPNVLNEGAEGDRTLDELFDDHD